MLTIFCIADQAGDGPMPVLTTPPENPRMRAMSDLFPSLALPLSIAQRPEPVHVRARSPQSAQLNAMDWIVSMYVRLVIAAMKMTNLLCRPGCEMAEHADSGLISVTPALSNHPSQSPLILCFSFPFHLPGHPLLCCFMSRKLRRHLGHRAFRDFCGQS
jgi:hypothetical protein